MAERKRKMQSKANIKKHWVDRLVEIGKFNSLDKTDKVDYCFACGFIADTTRAHIWARGEGGEDSCENIHLLCDRCHAMSEMLSGGEYWEWFIHGPFWFAPNAVSDVGEMAKNATSKRTREALARKKANGEHCGRIPFGFAIGADGKIHEVPEQMKTIIAMKRMHGIGVSVRAIAAKHGVSKSTAHKIITTDLRLLKKNASSK